MSKADDLAERWICFCRFVFLKGGKGLGIVPEDRMSYTLFRQRSKSTNGGGGGGSGRQVQVVVKPVSRAKDRLSVPIKGMERKWR